ncbi:acyl-coenzyme A thioesterase 1 [Latimeria chalumnae]|uniref:Acyl-CoA thioesterase 22 n=1 Tax=Latimeria chalumnae TaxID=7897 RepID=H3B4F8_LATCH|nr:PREDICTED: acyl-coenzyme A thioesterase 1-like [Latimeria chalumnae]|eukprot:XP_005997371.1 PREDICTED: acyl-coenzyme A thioesterase 1-like [Latimeria chalumnae]
MLSAGLFLRKHMSSSKSLLASPRAWMSVLVRVFPAAECMFDDPVRVEVTGLRPMQEVTLTACVKDDPGVQYRSAAWYRADEDGVVDLATSPALGGQYSGVRPMGLLESLEPETCFKRFSKRDVLTPACVRFGVYEGHGPPEAELLLAACTNQRGFMREGMQRIPVREGNIRATLFLPPGAGPFPAVVDLYGTAGGLLEYRASLLSSRGFVTLALAYFGFEDLPSFPDQFHLEYFQEAVQYLQNHPKVKDGGVGVIGLSKGGDLALSMGTFLPGVRAVVSICGCNCNSMAPLHYKGMRFPDLQYQLGRAKVTDSGCLDVSECLDDPLAPKNRDTIIPIERASGSFLFLVGESDKNWKSKTFAAEAVKRLKEHGKQNYEIFTYPGAGHLLEPPYFPMCYASLHKLVGRAILWGGEEKAHALAQVDAWGHIQAFLRANLAEGNPGRSKL